MRTFFISYKTHLVQVRANRRKGSGVIGKLLENLNSSDGKLF